MKLRTQLRLSTLILACALALPAWADPPGKNAAQHRSHASAPSSDIVCTRKPGTEWMQHEPKDHPMVKTRVMKNMDPAMHMLDCVDPTAATPARKVHRHKRPGG